MPSTLRGLFSKKLLNISESFTFSLPLDLVRLLSVLSLLLFIVDLVGKIANLSLVSALEYKFYFIISASLGGVTAFSKLLILGTFFFIYYY